MASGGEQKWEAEKDQALSYFSAARGFQVARRGLSLHLRDPHSARQSQGPEGVGRGEAWHWAWQCDSAVP